MRALILLTVVAPLVATAQTRPRRVLVMGAATTAPSGDRFAFGTRTGVVSVDARSATLMREGKPARLADLRPGSSLTVLGTLSVPSDGGRATIVAARIVIAPTPAPGTIRRAPALKRP